MLAATHIIFGMGCSLVSAGALGLPPEQTAVMVIAGGFGSLLPDIDHPSSTFGRRIRPLSNLIGWIFGHRGITHSLIAVLALATLLARHAHIPVWGIGLIVGYLSHLLGDWLTPAGIPLLWPIKNRWVSPFSFKTGGSMERVVGIGVVVAGLVWVFRSM